MRGRQRLRTGPELELGGALKQAPQLTAGPAGKTHFGGKVSCQQLQTVGNFHLVCAASRARPWDGPGTVYLVVLLGRDHQTASSGIRGGGQGRSRLRLAGQISPSAGGKFGGQPNRLRPPDVHTWGAALRAPPATAVPLDNTLRRQVRAQQNFTVGKVYLVWRLPRRKAGGNATAQLSTLVPVGRPSTAFSAITAGQDVHLRLAAESVQRLAPSRTATVRTTRRSTWAGGQGRPPKLTASTSWPNHGRRQRSCSTSSPWANVT